MRSLHHYEVILNCSSLFLSPPLQCEKCDLHFRHKSQLRLHLRQKHGAVTNTKAQYRRTPSNGMTTTVSSCWAHRTSVIMWTSTYYCVSFLNKTSILVYAFCIQCTLLHVGFFFFFVSFWHFKIVQDGVLAVNVEQQECTFSNVNFCSCFWRECGHWRTFLSLISIENHCYSSASNWIRTEFSWQCGHSICSRFHLSCRCERWLILSDCHLLAGYELFFCFVFFHPWLSVTQAALMFDLSQCVVHIVICTDCSQICYEHIFLLFFQGFCWYFAQTNNAVINIFCYGFHLNVST